MTHESRVLAKFAADFSYGQIPDRVRTHAIDLLVDQLGCELGCSNLPWAQQVRGAYCKSGGDPEATVVRYGDRVPARTAAFINSTFGHSFEYDDINPLIRGHPGAELIPPLLAVAERDALPGRDFLTAFVAAYEVRGRIGWALTPDIMEHGGPQPSTAGGPFGAAVGVARLLGLDAEGIHNALGIAGGFTGGLMQYDHGGGSVKRIYSAIAGSGGMQAAHLAQAGMTGPEEILEGARGLLKIYTHRYQTERLVADFGTKWIFDSIAFKPYSCLGIIASAIDGVTRLITRHHLTASDIEAIDVGYQKGHDKHAGGTAPHDLLGMQFSTCYSLALTVLKGRNSPAEYTMEALADPEVRAFAARVKVSEDAELTRKYQDRLPSRVKIRTRDGNVHEELVLDPKGSPQAPLSSGEIDAKFRSQAAAVLGAERCEALLHQLRNVDRIKNLAELPPLLVAARPAAGGR